MKRIKLLVFMMLGMSCLFQSCKSDLEDNTSNEKSSSLNQEILNARNKYSANVVDNSILDDYELKDGVIHFKDFESFKKTKSLVTCK